MKRPRRVILLGVFAGVALVILLFGALLPRLIDSQLIKDKITAELAKKTGRSFVFGNIALLWFPRPAVVIERARFSFDDRFHGSIPSAKIYPSIFYLLTGRVVVRRALLQEAKIFLRAPDRPEKPIDLGELEKQIRSALVRLTTGLPAPRIDLSGASAEIKIGDKPPIVIEDASLSRVYPPSDV